MLSVVVACSLIGWLMTRLHMLPGTTALWGMSPGAASVMTIMAESYGADIRLVALMQYLRVVGVAAVAAVVAKLFGVSAAHGPAAIVWFPPVAWLPLAETLALAILGPLVARLLRIPAGAFLVPLVAGIVFTHLGWMTIELPRLAAGGELRVRRLEHRPALHASAAVHAARALPLIVACTLLLIAICGGVAALMVWAPGSIR